MGWESAISLGANAVGAYTSMNTATADTKAIAQTADNTAANIANKTSRTEGSLVTSFLKGGISLTGAGGPAAIFQQAGAQGQTDIQRTITNANSSISNIMNSARTKALNGIASGISKLGAGTIGGAASSAYEGSWLQDAWNSAGQSVGGSLDPSPMGPYEQFGV